MIFTGAEILAGGVLDRLAKKTKLDEERFQQKEPEGLEKPDEAVTEENLSDQRQQLHTENSNAGGGKNAAGGVAEGNKNVIYEVAEGTTGGVDDVIEVELSKSKYPESVKHIEDAIAEGQPDVLTIDRSGAKKIEKHP